MSFKLLSKFWNFISNSLAKNNIIKSGAIIDPSVKISGSFIGESVKINSFCKIMGSTIKLHSIIGAHTFMKDTIVHARLNTDEKCRIYSCQFDGHINLGRYTSLWGPNLHIVTGKQKVFIGNFCSIARNVYMQTYNHNSKKLSTYFIGKHVFEENWKNEKISKGDIHIENDVWIGANAMILGGITIGNGAVVASNCVVTKDVPAFAIVAGVPAKIIGYRFDEPTIKKIEEMEWWNWPIEEIKNNKHLFEEELNETDF